MSRKIDRRDFLSGTARACAALCGACICSRLPAWAEGDDAAGEKVPVPAELNYCGYSCPPDCKFLEATRENDVELKKEAWKLWKIEERFGVPFDPEQAICHGCKTKDRPAGIVLRRCDVRACARERNLDCCIECEELTACDRDLWRRFPKFREQVIEMQIRYRA